MVDRWTEWKPFPDPFYGEFIAAPIGPGVYEVCDASTREQIAFGCTNNVVDSLTGVLKPGKARRRSLFRRWRARDLSSNLEYRSWPTDSLNDAKVVVDQILGQREAVWRRFSATMRA
ncbi:MAG: hypothetical protein FJX62_07525 [Alphaproteobacteria bacterium]|nr:hypothetical protein [Alphaproteobacteria bacterium]